jgi:hypothetical protein
MSVAWPNGKGGKLWHAVQGRLGTDPRILLTVCGRRCVLGTLHPGSASWPRCEACER